MRLLVGAVNFDTFRIVIVSDSCKPVLSISLHVFNPAVFLRRSVDHIFSIICVQAPCRQFEGVTSIIRLTRPVVSCQDNDGGADQCKQYTTNNDAFLILLTAGLLLVSFFTCQQFLRIVYLALRIRHLIIRIFLKSFIFNNLKNI